MVIVDTNPNPSPLLLSVQLYALNPNLPTLLPKLVTTGPILALCRHPARPLLIVDTTYTPPVIVDTACTPPP